MILGGIGVVLFQQSRLQLGWSRGELLQHSALRAAALMVSIAIASLYKIYSSLICFGTIF